MSLRHIVAAATGLATISLAHAGATPNNNDSNNNWATPAPNQPTDKSLYNLFNMTPGDKLRPVVADANDGVVDATTVDAGHAEIQGAAIDYFHYETSYGPVNYTSETWGWAPRISVGVLDNLEVFFHPYFHSASATYSYPGGFSRTHDSDGFEEINIGAKLNLVGNDEGTVAMAVAPYVSILDNGDILGGVDIPLGVRLPNGFYLKLMTDPYLFEHGHDSAYLGIENSMSLHKALLDRRVDAYAYLNTIWTSDDRDWQGYAGFGVGYFVIADLEVFAGIGFGLTDNSYDYNPRLGLAWRF